MKFLFYRPINIVAKDDKICFWSDTHFDRPHPLHPAAAGKRTRVTNQFTHPALCVFEDGYRQCAARPIAEPPH